MILALESYYGSYLLLLMIVWGNQGTALPIYWWWFRVYGGQDMVDVCCVYLAGCWRNSEGVTPVLIAASHGHCGALQLLLESGGDACQTDLEGNDAVTYAQESGCEQCCALTRYYAGLYWLCVIIAYDSYLLVAFFRCINTPVNPSHCIKCCCKSSAFPVTQ